MFFKYPAEFTRIDYKPGEKAEYVWGDGILLARIIVKSDTEGSIHDCEQISLVLGGEFDLTIGKETKRMKQGDAFYIPTGVFHKVRMVSAPAEIIDVWPREDRRYRINNKFEARNPKYETIPNYQN